MKNAASFEVKAFRKSVLSGEIEFRLIQKNNGFAFANAETGKVEIGSYTVSGDKFEALAKFKKLSGDIPVRFELV